MKSILCCLILVFTCLATLHSQRSIPLDTGKYRINLPDFWKPGNKVWKILTDKLPLVCDEIKDKQICGDDCRPAYSFELVISEPVVYDIYSSMVSSNYTSNQFVKPTETWNIQTLYGFQSFLLLINDKGTIITKFVLVDTNEVWRVTNRVTLPAYSSPPPPATQARRRVPVRYSRDNIIPVMEPQVPTSGQEGETSYSYINRNRDRLIPATRDLFAIVDKKIRAL